MAAKAPHRPLDGNERAWLLHLADPMGLAPRPERPLSAADLDHLLRAAATHGVLPAVARRLKAAPDAVYGGLPPFPGFVSDTLIGSAATSLALVHFGKRVTAALAAAGVPGTLVKGPVAAERLYPDPALRGFGDIDVLVAKGARRDSRAAMKAAGFVAIEDEGKRLEADYHEDKWHPAERPDLLIEIQDDLVHAPSLTHAMSLSFEDLLAAGGGDPRDATALLYLAAVHGAVGHQLDRLQYSVDICQAARGVAGPVDATRLAAVTRRNRTVLPVVAALDLAGRLFQEERCIALADRLTPVYGRRAARFLLTPGSVLSAQAEGRAAQSWRRQLFREIVKRAAARSR